jgi:dihydroorotate dehydrogenase (NAD+) catalytic subunit
VLTSASLTGYGAPPAARLVPYGLSPVARFLDLGAFGAVTTRTLTLEPREGHFTTRTDWRVRDWPELMGRYRGALRRVDAGWMNAFGWANIGVDAYLRDYFPCTNHLNRIVSVGGFSVAEFREVVEALDQRVQPGEIAAVELNVSCHNVDADFEAIVDEIVAACVPRSRHPLVLKLSPDSDYVRIATSAERHGISALTAINTIKGLRLDPETGEPFMRNRYGGISGRCIKPVGLRVVSELREAGVSLPILATGGIRTYNDAREYFWAGANAVSLGSEAFLFGSTAGYVASPLRAARVAAVRRRVAAYRLPSAAA